MTSRGCFGPTPGIRPQPSQTSSTRRNLAKGQTGLSIAFDLPTQTGYDSDHEFARGEVGKVGVPVSHLGDMLTLLDGIPLEQMNTSMTINATAAWLLSLYIAVADRAGASRDKLTGTIQNDIIKEYLSRGTYVFPPEPSLRLIKDTIVFSTRTRAEVESDERLLLPSAGSRRDAGAGTRVRAGDGHRRPRTVKASRRSAGRRFRQCRRPRIVLRQRRHALRRPRCARCAHSPSFGTRSRASATA